jgi:leader peptidase (prepilin peptidase)/N-methyltransferase
MGWQALLPVVLLSAVQGSVVGVALILLGRDPSARKEPAPPVQETTAAPAVADAAPPSPDDDWVPPRHAVPYGPFLSLAALEVLLMGPRLSALWENLLRRLFA